MGLWHREDQGVALVDAPAEHHIATQSEYHRLFWHAAYPRRESTARRTSLLRWHPSGVSQLCSVRRLCPSSDRLRVGDEAARKVVTAI